MNNSIQYLKHSEIDQAKWDKAIDNSTNGLVYAYSWVLDHMTDRCWDALVTDDYSFVFPLPWTSKWGIKYLYQPYFCQQLGLFAPVEITAPLLNRFLAAIPKHFRYWNIQLNSRNYVDNPSVSLLLRTTYQISLQRDYQDLEKNFSRDAKKNLTKAANAGFDWVKTTDLSIISRVYIEAYGKHYPGIDSIMKKVMACMESAVASNNGFTRAVYGKDGELWCAGFFFYAKNHIHYALAAPTEEGKKFGATHTLISEVVREFSGKDLIFDFEGSDIPSVAFFYAKFGSQPISYPTIIYNGLPWWCRFLKRG